jgi:hypothetical protein
VCWVSPVKEEFKITLERVYYNIICMIKSLQFSVSYGLKQWTSGVVTFIGHLKKIQANTLNQYEKNGIQKYIPVK